MTGDRTRRAILEAYRQQPGAKLRQIGEMVGKQPSSVHANRVILMENGLLRPSTCECCGASTWVVVE